MHSVETLAASDPRQQLGEFAQYLRQHGYVLGYSEVELMARAASALPLSHWQQRRIEALWRGIACGNQRQWRQYHELHQTFWFPHKVKGSVRSMGLHRHGRSLPEVVQRLKEETNQTPPKTFQAQKPLASHLGLVDTTLAMTLDDAQSPHRAQGGASRTAPREQRDFAQWLTGDWDRFEALVERFRRRLRADLSRRYRPNRFKGPIHLRRSLRAALATGGELVQLQHAQRPRRHPRVAVLVDVSRSMDVHAQLFLRLSQAFVEVLDARAFVFHTQAVEITSLLKRRNPRIKEKLHAVSAEFGGGTRIATSLGEALRTHLKRFLRHGDWMLIFSDGYDTDQPDALATVLAQIRACGTRIGWLHPTKDLHLSAALSPAAIYVTRFLPIHNLASLARLPELIR